MKRSKIEISLAGVVIEDTNLPVLMTASEIAEMFGVFVATINSNIRSLSKSQIVDLEEVMIEHKFGDGRSVELYKLEMIIALAGRIASPQARMFRKRVAKRVVHEENTKVQPIYFSLNAQSKSARTILN